MKGSDKCMWLKDVFHPAMSEAGSALQIEGSHVITLEIS